MRCENDEIEKEKQENAFSPIKIRDKNVKK